MNLMMGILDLVLAGQSLVLAAVAALAVRHALVMWRSRPPSARLPDADFLGEVHVARELRRAERDFGVGIDRIDAAYGLSRHPRRRVDPGMPAWQGGAQHAEG